MQCQWIKADGDQCKRRAVVGEQYCHTHLKMYKEEAGVVETAPAVPVLEDENVATIHSNKPMPLRFIGKGSYSIPSLGIFFYEKGQVLTVDHDTWKRLLEEQPDAFEEA